MAEQKKVKFAGVVESVQPRSNVWRYRLDNRVCFKNSRFRLTDS